MCLDLRRVVVCSVSVSFPFLPLESGSLQSDSSEVCCGRKKYSTPAGLPFHSIPYNYNYNSMHDVSGASDAVTRPPSTPSLQYLPRVRSALGSSRRCQAATLRNCTRLIRFRTQLTRRCPTTRRRLLRSRAAKKKNYIVICSALCATCYIRFSIVPWSLDNGRRRAQIYPLRPPILLQADPIPARNAVQSSTLPKIGTHPPSHKSTHTLTMLRRLIGVLRPLRVTQLTGIYIHECSWGF
jgi:hypothetical protein